MIVFMAVLVRLPAAASNRPPLSARIQQQLEFF
jgi:hypothetical protein